MLGTSLVFSVKVAKKFKPTFDTQGSSQTGEEDKRVFQLFLFNEESVRPSAA